MAHRDVGFITFTAGEALTYGRAVRLSTTADQVVYADAGEHPIGTVAVKSVVSGAEVTVKLLGPGHGTNTMIAGAAVAAQAQVACLADGKVDDAGGQAGFGWALTAATADGDEIEVLPFTSLSESRVSTATETLAATKTLTIDDAKVQFLDPGGAGRDVNLPAEALSDGLEFVIHNTADAAEILTVKDDGGATIATPTQAETAYLVCNGTLWAASVGASS